MNFDLTDEHRMIRNMACDFAREIVAPFSGELDRTGEYPYEIMSRMAELGMMGLPFPERYGGGGGDWVGMHICIEEISTGDPALGALLDVTTSIVAQEIYAFGDEKQRKEWLTPLARGETIGAFALTEPDAGSDAGALRTKAVRRGDQWILNGTKQFVTNIGLDNASLVIVAARVEHSPDGHAVATFIVPKDAPGFRLGKRYDKMAWHSSATHEVILEDCVLESDCLLGDPARGLAQHLTVLETGRISIAAVCVGGARACLDHSTRYALQREQFGQPIIDFQAVQFKLADMAVAVELARNQYLKAAWLKDQGRPHTFEATVAKLYASEMYEKVASDAVQIHGGYGYMNEYPVSRLYKGAKLLQIVEGTSEVQRLILGRLLGAG